MAKKFTVKTRAVFNNTPPGSTIKLDEKAAHKYAAMKYVDIIAEVKAPAKKATSAPKKPASKTAAKKTTTKK